VQIGGPTGAFVVIVAGVVAQHGYDGLAVATVMAGVLLVLMAIARLGEVLRFVPYPVTVGFTSGIAIIIAVGQVGDALGLALARAPADFLERCRAYAGAIGTVNWAAAGVCAGTILVVQFWPRVNRRIPGPLVALLATTAAVRALGLDVDTIGSRFGEIPTGLPAPRLPRVDWSHLSALVSPAVSIALLGGIESLLSALVADGQIGGRHRSNAELMGQGIANIVSPIFGGIPATGAIARTATNVRNGGRTPVAGIAHAATLLVIVLVAGRWAVYIPIATLAGILLLVAYNMSEWRVFAQLLRSPRSDVLVLMTTFALTVAVDLTVAIQAGVVLAALLFMRRMAAVTQVKAVPNLMDYEGAAGAEGEAEALAIPDGVEVFAVNGSFCFGAARKFTETLAVRRSRPRAVVLDLKNVIAMDATGLHRMAYWDWAGPSADAPVLVCVHGLSRQGRDFDALARAMSDRYRVVCPDVVGRGRSDWLRQPSGYQIPAYVSDIVALLARLDVEQVDWVGTSMGGLIGLGLAQPWFAPLGWLGRLWAGHTVEPIFGVASTTGVHCAFSDGFNGGWWLVFNLIDWAIMYFFMLAMPWQAASRKPRPANKAGGKKAAC